MFSKLRVAITRSKLYKLLNALFYNPDGSIREWTVPLVLLCVAFLCYGLYAKHMGFYWDDWGFAWPRQFLGGQEFTAWPNRPLRIYVERALTPVLGIDPLVWQVAAILARSLAAMTLWWSMRQIWPKHAYQRFAVALLYVVYPGFSQQPMAMTYLYFWLVQIVFFFSLGAMVWAIRHPRALWPGLLGSLVLSGLQMFACEYFVGLELLRPFLLWQILRDSAPRLGERFRRLILYYSPFAVLLGGYVYWRLFVGTSALHQAVLLDQIRANPGQGITELLKTIWHAFGVVTIGAWENTLQVNLGQFIYRVKTIFPALIIIVTAGLTIYMGRLGDAVTGGPSGREERAAWPFIGFGLLTLLVAGIPCYVGGFIVGPSFEADRFSLAYIPGVGLLFVGLLELLPRRGQSVALLAFLAGLAVGYQYYNSALFRQEVELQKRFAWQLAWRIPALKPATALLSDDLPFPYTDDEGIAFLVNWMYAPEDYGVDHLSYDVEALSTRLETNLPSLEPNQVIYNDIYDVADFTGSTNRVVVFYFRPPSCLRVLNPLYDDGLVLTQIYKMQNGRPVILHTYALPPLVAKALPLSNMDQIVGESAQSFTPPEFLYGSEPWHDWCFYFEKADLARQEGDWQEVIALGEEAFQRQLFPFDLSEYLVFIEAYTRLGRWDEAHRLLRRVSSPAPFLNPALCAILQRVERDATVVEEGKVTVEEWKQELACESNR